MDELPHLISLEEIEEEDAELAAMYEEFGFAGYSAQRLENHMVMLLSLNEVLAGKFTDIAKAQASVKSAIVKTAGTLRTELAEYLDDGHLKKLIDHAVSKRNYLTHQFFREHEHDELTQAGRLAMIRECREISESFNEISTTWLMPRIRRCLERIETDLDTYIPGFAAIVAEQLAGPGSKRAPRDTLQT